MDQFMLHNVEIQHDGNNYAVNTMKINEAISYKYGCSFEDSEGEARIYNSSRINSNIFTKAKLMSIHLSQIILQHRISIAAYRDINLGLRSATKTVDSLLKSKSSVKGHEYDVCLSGCLLYVINDN
ncbi:hypothetical protein PHYBLDRAFT_145521 [Phycomyces blakesleeanus NRRL 1555(-)]|uniref:Uncharacterized protein n=1 Tax=Phycomyces blakesleeanus (strain ATCC 8743b / DSM 1359 / FGSC 10004 / NBRC 33097 / NRRL 1555) TaxID=763407 RepID=A0A162NGR7_PHYB8|nr:hypothetical protein PHYBLDRAFT_145521 [Phycomyces blakesleeanus NRRL 1555(-)]OAD74058.1 hypothetical protein PHYBLDRAFT_145521 [Phycomyces blakesleeanus NRRL 1555(-)]|eukprot:XP_018292098.1 hypothetical protein PHYBLDRAFT_145521 [Phycomyces blakesleeanus NRRL 1555(-)]